MTKRKINNLAILLIGSLTFSSAACAQYSTMNFPSTAPSMPEFNSGVHFCNESKGDDYLWVAINHYSGGKWFREGWWEVPFNDCKTVLSRIENRYIYYHAHNGSGKAWEGSIRYCTKSSAFKIEVGSSCDSDDIRGFKELDLEDYTSFRVTLD